MSNARNLAKVAVDANGDIGTASLDNLTGALGYTPVDKAGDTMTGTLTINQNNSGGLSAINLPADETTIQGPATNTQIRMGGNLVLNASGQASIGTNGVGSRVVIDSAGRVTMPYQPHILGTPGNGTSGNSGTADRFAVKTSRGLTYANSRITVPVAGVYLITFQTITSSGSGRIDTHIYINNIVTNSGLNETNTTGFRQRTHSLTIYLNASDFINFQCGSWYIDGNSFDQFQQASVTLLG